MIANEPWTLAGDAPVATIARQGFVHLAPAQLCALSGVDIDALEALRPSWDRLLPDGYLKDGGRYRCRRHSCFVHEPASGRLTQAPHRAHWQPLDYNALHGGIERMFEPVEPAVAAAPAWHKLLAALGRLFADVAPAERWFIEAHQFRIDTTDGVGRPTPEGAHRDGVDFVAVVLVARHHLRGGETRVFQADGPQGIRFVMREPWSAVLLDDLRMIHEATPIQPDGDAAHRDTLVLTYRRNGFQSPDSDLAGSPSRG